MTANQKSRRVHFVFNNYAENCIDNINDVLQNQQKNVIYYCGCKEISDTGTPHIHLYVAFQALKHFNTLKGLFSEENPHIEKCNGSSEDNRNYCIKAPDGKHADKAHTRVEGSFFEWGDCPTDDGQGNRTDLETAYQQLEDGLQ